MVLRHARLGSHVMIYATLALMPPPEIGGRWAELPIGLAEQTQRELGGLVGLTEDRRTRLREDLVSRERRGFRRNIYIADTAQRCRHVGLHCLHVGDRRGESVHCCTEAFSDRAQS